MGNALLDLLQGASNAAASNVSGPVDLLAWALRKAGVPVQNPVLGSEWMEQRGLTKKPQNAIMGLLGEAAGLSAPIAAVARGPQIARGLLKAEEAAKVGSYAVGQKGADMAEGYLMRSGLAPQAVPLQKPANDAAMNAANYERGWFRGGPKPVDNRMTGPWYTRNEDEAADYARRFGANADVREYAIPSNMMLKMDRAYDPRLAADLSARAESDFGQQGAKLAKLIRSSYGPGERAPGIELWRSASMTLGEDAAAELFGSLGFRSVLGAKGPDYVRLLPGATARDANRAAFDPNKIHLDNIMAGVGGLGLLGALSRNRDDE